MPIAAVDTTDEELGFGVLEPSRAMKKAAANTTVDHSWGVGGEYITEESAANIYRVMLRVWRREQMERQQQGNGE